MPLPLKKFLLGATLLAVLAAVFASYLAPEFMLDVANRIVLCF